MINYIDKYGPLCTPLIPLSAAGRVYDMIPDNGSFDSPAEEILARALFQAMEVYLNTVDPKRASDIHVFNYWRHSS